MTQKTEDFQKNSVSIRRSANSCSACIYNKLINNNGSNQTDKKNGDAKDVKEKRNSVKGEDDKIDGKKKHSFRDDLFHFSKKKEKKEKTKKDSKFHTLQFWSLGSGSLSSSNLLSRSPLLRDSFLKKRRSKNNTDSDPDISATPREGEKKTDVKDRRKSLQSLGKEVEIVITSNGDFNDHNDKTDNKPIEEY